MINGSTCISIEYSDIRVHDKHNQIEYHEYWKRRFHIIRYKWASETHAQVLSGLYRI